MWGEVSEKTVKSVAVSTPASSGVLMGCFEHALDPKKRLTVPSEWRETLGGPGYVYVMRDPSGKCLNLVPSDEMDIRLAKLREKALFDPALNRALMTIGANSQQLRLDSQGRIRIADELLQFAKLTTTVTMVGSVRMVKLWNPKAYAAETGVGDIESYTAALRQLEF